MSYKQERMKGGPEVEAKITRAIKYVAGGMSIREATRLHEAPYSPTWRALQAMQVDPAVWSAFKVAAANAKVLASPTKETPAPESPLGPRLRRKCTRFGDAMPYGKHGEWGMYREGVKEMTRRIRTVAAEGLGLLKTNQFDLIKLNKPQLQSLVRVLKVGNANQNKGALKDMLTSRFGDITPTQFRYRDDGATGHRIGFAAACPERPPRAPNARSRGCHPTTARGGQSPGFAASRDTLELSVA